MNAEVVPLFGSEGFKEGSIVIAQSYGIIGDNLIYPEDTIKILRILSGEYCDLQHNREHPSCVEVIIEGGIMKTTKENLMAILQKSTEQGNKKRATA